MRCAARTDSCWSRCTEVPGRPAWGGVPPSRDGAVEPSALHIGITTAVDEDAPRLFQWDHTFSWYVWNGGSPAAQFGLSAGWVSVAGITRLPARWDDDGERFKHQGDGIILLLDGARETRDVGTALFPSLLRAELHGVRATVEAHSNAVTMAGLAEGSAVGIDLRDQGNAYPASLRVVSNGWTQAYTIDRWD